MINDIHDLELLLRSRVPLSQVMAESLARLGQAPHGTRQLAGSYTQLRPPSSAY